MKFKKLSKKFLKYTKIYRSPKTYRCYTRIVNNFNKTLANKKLNKIKPHDVQKALDIMNENKSIDTQIANISLWHNLQNWSIQQGYLKNTIIKFKRPKGRIRTRILTNKEEKLIINNAKTDFKLFYLALRYSGARPNELCQANISDYYPEQKKIILKEHKTSYMDNRSRIIYIGYHLEKIIKQSIDQRLSGPLFIKQNGERWSANVASTRFRRLRNKLGLSKDLVLYCTRHKHATEICRQSGIDIAKELLGHRDIKTTVRYNHPNDNDLIKAQNNISKTND